MEEILYSQLESVSQLVSQWEPGMWKSQKTKKLKRLYIFKQPETFMGSISPIWTTFLDPIVADFILITQNVAKRNLPAVCSPISFEDCLLLSSYLGLISPIWTTLLDTIAADFILITQNIAKAICQLCVVQ